MKNLHIHLPRNRDTLPRSGGPSTHQSWHHSCEAMGMTSLGKRWHNNNANLTIRIYLGPASTLPPMLSDNRTTSGIGHATQKSHRPSTYSSQLLCRQNAQNAMSCSIISIIPYSPAFHPTHHNIPIPKTHPIPIANSLMHTAR
jgi:hypothetical protein